MSAALFNEVYMFRPLADDSGFTLTEFLIAILLLTVGMFSVVGVYEGITRSNASNRRIAAATMIAQQELEDVRRKGFDRFTSTVSKTVSGYQVTASANHIRRQSTSPYQKVYSSPVKDAMTVNVSVTWSPGTHSVSMQTIMAK